MNKIVEYVSAEKTMADNKKFEKGDVAGMEFFFHGIEDLDNFLNACVESLKETGCFSYDHFRSLFGYSSTPEHVYIGWTDDSFFDIKHYCDGWHSVKILLNPKRFDSVWVRIF